MELKVDETKCMGCGACVSQYPDNFDFDGETGLSHAISNENATPEMADICPVGAITAEEAGEPTETEVEEDMAA